jgi:hypothetical protein
MMAGLKKTLEEVERFARDHTGCGTLTPRTSPPAGDRYLLTLACSCGKTLERWVPLEDASDRDAATSIPMSDPEPPATPAIDITAEAASRESFDDVMAAAVEALEAHDPGRPSEATALGEALRAALDALDAEQQAPPRPPSEPVPPSPPLPPSQPVPASGRAPTGAKPAAAPGAGPPPPPSSPPTAASGPGTLPAGTRPPPDKQTLQDALRATIEALETERAQERPRLPRATSRSPVIAPSPAPASERSARMQPPERRRRFSMVAAILAVSLLGIVGVWYGTRAPGEGDRASTATGPVPARPKLAESERLAITQALGVLRELQSISTVDVPYRVYFNRFSFARAEADRHLADVRDAEARAALGDAVALHSLAANAWRAKTLNERDKWETVGQDPAADHCVATRRVLGIADEPANMSRAQWRGMALAASIPLLWDCAGERLAEIDRMLRDR